MPPPEQIARRISEVDRRSDVADANIEQVLIDGFDLTYEESRQLRLIYDRGFTDGFSGLHVPSKRDDHNQLYLRAFTIGQSCAQLSQRLFRKTQKKHRDRSTGQFQLLVGILALCVAVVVMILGIWFKSVIVLYGLFGFGAIWAAAGFKSILRSFKGR